MKLRWSHLALVALLVLGLLCLAGQSLAVAQGQSSTPAPSRELAEATSTPAAGAAVFHTAAEPGSTAASTASGWKCDPSGGPACFNDPESVAMVSPTEGWAVGWGTIMHYINGSWQAVPYPTIGLMRSGGSAL